MWNLALATLALVSGLSQNPPLAEASVSALVPSARPIVQSDVRPPVWQMSLRALGPVSGTDPQHVALTAGLSYTGAYRAAVQYQPSDTGGLGLIQASLGLRVLTRETWQLTADLEHAQARPVRSLFRGSGWELAGHERHQLSIVTASLRWSERRFFGLVGAVEAGGGQMHVWRLVSARAGPDMLSTSPDPIMESSAPVGMLGLTAARPLFWGLEAQTRFRVIGGGHSRGGEVPFAHMTVEWDVTRPMFQSKKFGRGFLGLTGNHATSSRAVAYFQNGLGLAFRVAF